METENSIATNVIISRHINKVYWNINKVHMRMRILLNIEKTNMMNASSFNATNVITKAKKKDCLLCTRKQSMRDLGSNVKNAITVVLTEAHIHVTRKLHIVEQKFLNLSICLRWFVIAQYIAMIQFHNKRKPYLWSLWSWLVGKRSRLHQMWGSNWRKWRLANSTSELSIVNKTIKDGDISPLKVWTKNPQGIDWIKQISFLFSLG